MFFGAFRPFILSYLQYKLQNIQKNAELFCLFFALFVLYSSSHHFESCLMEWFRKGVCEPAQVVRLSWKPSQLFKIANAMQVCERAHPRLSCCHVWQIPGSIEKNAWRRGILHFLKFLAANYFIGTIRWARSNRHDPIATIQWPVLNINGL